MKVQQKTLPDVISNIIEELAMVMLEKVEGKVENFDPKLTGWIDFEGPVNGRLRIKCNEKFAEILAGNLLGTNLEDFETQANAWDAIAELLNIVCGNVVAILYDADRRFTLSAPQVNTTDNVIPDTHMTQKNVETCILSMEGEPAEFSLITEAKST